MAARTALLQMARRTAAAPVHVTRRNMSGGLTIQQERAEMLRWQMITFTAIPACAALGIYLFSQHPDHHEVKERPAYSYLNIRLKIFPWGGNCSLFEYGACQEKTD
eukprot:CAMPEP_0181374398 /NCGR_PEP_ID=MMETSP1106-20121128/15998_1 /TAXON_ID=81844 /ORGANISM="Mantoniella antarctica, Strain SL-175" /LENGTH=105 /DNA_ID=CAMNT_0023492375 /DNA_START=38 /DNA_END=355 /DNA_ORIENTATION=-